MAKKKIEEIYQELTQEQHLLKRPGMYVGSTKLHNTEFLSPEEDQNLKITNINIVPAFLKLFDEIISNSVDESKKDGNKLNTIKVNIRDNEISVWDNGGIPVVVHKETKSYVPEMIFSKARAGSSFDDTEQRTSVGTNGIGAYAVNVFSKTFSVTTCDGKNKFVQVFSDNMSKRTKPKVSPSSKNHTEISYVPDYERFGMEKLDEDHTKMIKKRVYDIAGCNPNLKVFFNDVQIKFKSFEDYVSLYVKDYIFEEHKNWQFAVCANPFGAFKQISFVNTVETFDGGTHIDYIMNQVVVQIREYINKKHKVDVKPLEIKNHIFFFCNSTIINPMFTSQTKEKLSTEIKDFGSTCQVTEAFVKRILKSEIVASLLDWLDKKQQAEENKELRKLNKGLDGKNVLSLIDAKGKDRSKCTLNVFEGQSAMSAFRQFRRPESEGAFPLRGKFMNVLEENNSNIIQNKEVVNLMAAIGLRLGEIPTNLRYGKIYIATDSDVDGNSISALLINFFHRFWPQLFEQKRIYKVLTPLLVAKRGANTKYFYFDSEYQSWAKTVDLKNWEISYKKGLASLEDDEYEEMVKQPKLLRIDSDSLSKQTIVDWFGADNENRKNILSE